VFIHLFVSVIIITELDLFSGNEITKKFRLICGNVFVVYTKV